MLSCSWKSCYQSLGSSVMLELDCLLVLHGVTDVMIKILLFEISTIIPAQIMLLQCVPPALLAL